MSLALPHEEGGIPEGACFPKGDEGTDFTEADIFCEDDYCPNTPPEEGCEGRVLVDAICSREVTMTTYHQCMCECCEQQLEVGGTPDNPEVWEEVYTCLLEGDPPCQQDERVELELVQSGACGQTVDWTISEGEGEGNQYSGTLTNGSFNWTSVPGTDTPEEEGCWQFSNDAQKFNKLSTGSGFDCVGIGTRGDGSDPGTTPTCDEIVNAGLPDFTQCPPAP